MADKEPMMQAFEWKENPLYKDQAQYFTFEQYYDIPTIIQEIKDKNYKDIILQFPVENLSDAIKVQSAINKNLPATNIYIISDHLKNSCCVDIVGSNHINYDIIFHFGVACLSESEEQQQKIKYIFPRVNMDLVGFTEQAQLLTKSDDGKAQNYIILIDQYQYYLSQEIFQQFKDQENVTLALIQLDKTQKINHLFYGYYLNKPLDKSKKYQLIFTGHEDSDLLEKIFFAKDKFNIEKVYVYNNQIKESPPVSNKSLIKRLSMIEQARDIKCFGILIQNPNTQFCRAVTERVKQVIQYANKKFYTFYMSNLNEAKLNNFPEVEAFVIVSCYRNSLFDLKKYYKLIITPFELEMALRNQSFSNYFLIDGLNQEIEALNLEDIEKEPEDTEQEKKKQANNSQALVAISEENKVAIMGIFQTLDHFTGRNFQGLDINQNVDVKLAVQGLSGIASSYASDRDQNKQ
ncbi:hypothetical protein ABPG74_010692 [Tetrahymena malaccensis]